MLALRMKSSFCWMRGGSVGPARAHARCVNRALKYACSMRLAALLMFVPGAPLAAQNLHFGAGVNFGSIPRAENPLCASARRLVGPGVSARAGLAFRALRLSATVDHVTNGGVTEAAGCVPRTGISTDSVFAPAGTSATTLGATAWLPMSRILRAGAEAGWVLDHSSWFVGPALGAQYRRFGIEIAGRRFATSFDEVTTDYGPPFRGEVARASRVESSWGLIARVLLVTK